MAYFLCVRSFVFCFRAQFSFLFCRFCHRLFFIFFCEPVLLLPTGFFFYEPIYPQDLILFYFCMLLVFFFAFFPPPFVNMPPFFKIAVRIPGLPTQNCPTYSSWQIGYPDRPWTNIFIRYVGNRGRAHFCVNATSQQPTSQKPKDHFLRNGAVVDRLTLNL